MRRRTFLSTAGAAAASLVTVGQVSAAEKYSEQPDNVTLTGYSNAKADIKKYRPLLVLRDLDVRPTALYAWRATSEDYDLDWYSYWAFYQVQFGHTDDDSHLPDREPIYVGVEDSGSVVRVLYSKGHYAKATDSDPSLYEKTHPRLYVVNPHHHYERTEDDGEFVDLGDMDSVYSDWLTNGWSVSRTAVVDPASMTNRDTWWPDTREASFDHRLATLWSGIDIPYIDISNPFRRT